MTTTMLEAEPMARKTADDMIGSKDAPIGPTLAANLHRLGWATLAVKSSELSELVNTKTKKKMTRQRISSMMNAVRVERETIEAIAKAIGVKASDLTKPIDD